jgi:mannan endo-1,4-beta-mannosidase
MVIRIFIFLVLLSSVETATFAQQPSFVTVRGNQLVADGKPYYFVGTNYWYGSLIALEKDKKRGVERLRKELDFLKVNGVTNLRLMAGAEGSGLLNGVNRVGPPIQIEQGMFDESALEGLDILLDEMSMRDMRAVIFLSNNWEWSGGFQQYLIWNKVISDQWLTRKPEWEELRDLVAKFYSCSMCKFSYARQVARVVRRKNSVNGKKYNYDPTIMSWQIANEPRPMRPVANDAYKKWIAETAAQLRGIAPRQLISIGHEGWVGTQDIKLFEAIHDDKNVDYVTIHIWPKNWGWFESGKMAEQFQVAVDKSMEYIDSNGAVAIKLGKPLVIEEFGLPRDKQSFEISAATSFRDTYFEKILKQVRTKPYIAGANFWTFGGKARPLKGQLFWKSGDEYMGDPPMEEQGLYSIFDSDRSTWKIVKEHSRRVRSGN